MPVDNVAASSAATSAWANSVADSVNGLEDDLYVAGQISIPWANLTGKPATFAPTTAAATAATAYGLAKSDGVSAAAARADHIHGTPALPSFGSSTATTTYGLTKADGSATTTYARSDHTHGTPPLPTPAQLAIPWTEITGKPSTFAPSAHASSHAAGGSDAVTPTAIGAAAAYDTPATLDGGKRIYVGTATPTGASEGDIWIKG
jgi:hypothetical protein